MPGLQPQGGQPRPLSREAPRPAQPLQQRTLQLAVQPRLPCALQERHRARMLHRTKPGPSDRHLKQRLDCCPAVQCLSSPLALEGAALDEGSRTGVLRQKRHLKRRPWPPVILRLLPERPWRRQRRRRRQLLGAQRAKRAGHA